MSAGTWSSFGHHNVSLNQLDKANSIVMQPFCGVVLVFTENVAGLHAENERTLHHFNCCLKQKIIQSQAVDLGCLLPLEHKKISPI